MPTWTPIRVRNDMVCVFDWTTGSAKVVSRMAWQYMYLIDNEGRR